ncbi:hypothetical protein PILCRDRAFT_277717 [Piloderma croceum F 1598]|uniref:Protein kinase domain-containing protein n=1 Tax=Piloderma croceum (strain F 1598) TaxID=765440 RepID=A0A0C3GA15_PILCF|nr:hypothetical protein PILCRDRAFT_277717 [Piloderma croceum F 1598]
MVKNDVKLTNMTLVASVDPFKEIWKGWTHAGEGIAVKVLRVEERTDAKLLKGLSTEAKAWQKLSHPNVLPFHGLYCVDSDLPSLGLISLWMEKGNLTQFLQKEDVGRVPFILDIVEGLEYLHSFQPTILHGSLKCVSD